MKTQSIFQILALMLITAILTVLVTVDNLEKSPKTVDNLEEKAVPSNENICDNYECKMGKG